MELKIKIGRTGNPNVFDVRIPHHGWSCCLVKAKDEEEARLKFYRIIIDNIAHNGDIH